MFYMPTAYSQTDFDSILQEQSEQQQQVCAEGEVFNEQTQICEPTSTTEITTDLGTETLEELAAPAEVEIGEEPVEEQQAPVEEK